MRDAVSLKIPICGDAAAKGRDRSTVEKSCGVSGVVSGVSSRTGDVFEHQKQRRCGRLMFNRLSLQKIDRKAGQTRSLDRQDWDKFLTAFSMIFSLFKLLKFVMLDNFQMT